MSSASKLTLTVLTTNPRLHIADLRDQFHLFCRSLAPSLHPNGMYFYNISFTDAELAAKTPVVLRTPILRPLDPAADATNVQYKIYERQLTDYHEYAQAEATARDALIVALGTFANDFIPVGARSLIDLTLSDLLTGIVTKWATLSRADYMLLDAQKSILFNPSISFDSQIQVLVRLFTILSDSRLPVAPGDQIAILTRNLINWPLATAAIDKFFTEKANADYSLVTFESVTAYIRTVLVGSITTSNPYAVNAISATPTITSRAAPIAKPFWCIWHGHNTTHATPLCVKLTTKLTTDDPRRSAACLNATGPGTYNGVTIPVNGYAESFYGRGK